MREFFRLLAVLLLVLTLSACGETAPPTVSNSTPPAPPGSSGPSQPVVTPSDPAPQPGTSSSATPETPPESLRIPELTVELPRALDTTAARKAMQRLPERMAAHGVDIGSVSISFGPTYAATATALRQGSVQLAFLPAEDYLQLGGMALLLTDTHFDGDEQALGVSTLICAGPSFYGAKLADIAEDRPLTWSELDHARWGVLEDGSLTGYRCLRLWLEDNYEDNAVSDLSQVTVYESWEALMQAAAAEEIDLFPLAPELSADWESRWSTDFARTDSFAQAVRTVGRSEGICTWVTAAAPEDEAVNDPRFLQALEAVINKLFDDPSAQGAAIGAERYGTAADEDLNPLRRLRLSEA